jgi:hypothetical protein
MGNFEKFGFIAFIGTNSTISFYKHHERQFFVYSSADFGFYVLSLYFFAVCIFK